MLDVKFFQDYGIEKGNEMLYLLSELKDINVTEQDPSPLK